MGRVEGNVTTRSLDSTLNILAFSFVLQLEWSTADRLIKHDVDAQDDDEAGEFYDADYDDDEVKLAESGAALIMTMPIMNMMIMMMVMMIMTTMMMVMMRITTKRSC